MGDFHFKKRNALAEPRSSQPTSALRVASSNQNVKAAYSNSYLTSGARSSPTSALQLASFLKGLRATSNRAALNLAAVPQPTSARQLATFFGGLGTPSPKAAFMQGAAAAPHKWVAVIPRFTQLNDNLQLTALQVADGMRKRKGVVAALNRIYYNSTSDTQNSFFVGSWAKQTAVRPPRDVDVFYELPYAVWRRFESHTGNRQSALLQEVKGMLVRAFPTTVMRGDGQVVCVNFGTYKIELVPSIRLQSGQFWICDTNEGGRYKLADPRAEAVHIEASDAAAAGNLRRLVRMLKCWQSWCGVPIKSFQLELIAARFLEQSPWRTRTYFYFDWIVRDFFLFLLQHRNYFIAAPGTGESIYLGEAWYSRAESAYGRALQACQYEAVNLIEAAGDQWQKVFGPDVPRSV